MSTGATNRKAGRLAMAAAVAALAWATSCAREEQVAEPAPTPAPEPSVGVVTGVVSLEGEEDYSGTLVFLGGSGYNAYTDRQGRYRIPDIEPGRYEVVAQSQGFRKKQLDEIVVDASRPGLQEFALAPAELPRRFRAREVVERALGAITGVVHYADRETHGGIYIRIVDSVHITVSNETGFFSLPNLEPGPYLLRFTAEGYEPREVPVVVRAGEIAQLTGEGQDIEVIDLAPQEIQETTRRLEGAVEAYGLDGEKIELPEDTLVSLEGAGFVAAPDEGGRFVIEGIPPGRYMVAAQAAGFILREKRAVNLRWREPPDVTLTLDQAPASQPEIGAIIGAVQLEGDVESMAGVQVGLAGASRVALTDVSGFFAITEVPAGVYSLVATFEGYERAVIDGVAVESGMETDVGEIPMSVSVNPPRVLMSDPPDGARNVRVERIIPVWIRFSDKMAPASVLSAVAVTPPVAYGAYIGRGHPNSDHDLLYLELPGVGDGAIGFNETVRVRVDTSAKDFEDVELAEPFSLSFTTGKAEIIGTDPEDGASNVVRSATVGPVRVFFNAPARHETLNDRNVTVRPDDGDLVRVQAIDDPETGWTTANLLKNWRPGQTYEITISSRVRLVGRGGRLENTPYTFRFTTATGEPVGQRHDQQNPRRPRRARRD